VQTIGIAIAISFAIGGAFGAGATSIALSFATSSHAPPVCFDSGVHPQQPPFQHIPTTGSAQF
jgi:hypothetical protein